MVFSINDVESGPNNFEAFLALAHQWNFGMGVVRPVVSLVVLLGAARARVLQAECAHTWIGLITLVFALTLLESSRRTMI